MFIKKLFIEKYKNLSNLKIDFDPKNRTTFFLGSNGTGKTNLFEAILLIFQSLQEKFSNGTQRNQKDSKEIFNFMIEYTIENESVRATNKDFFVNNKRLFYTDFSPTYLPKNIIIYNSGDSKRLYELFYRRRTKIYPKISMIIMEYDVQKQLALDYLLSNNLIDEEIADVSKVVFYFQPGKIKGMRNFLGLIEDQAYSGAMEFIRNFDIENKSIPNQTLKIELTKDTMMPFFYGKTGFFPTLQGLSKMGLFSSFSTSRKDYFQVFLGTTEIEFSDLGEGVQLMVSLKAAVNKFAEEETLFLLDEPDAFIHPSNIQKLVQTIEKSNSQFLITTHSPILISRLKNGCVKRLDHEAKTVSTGYGRKINYLFQDLMGFEDYPQEIKEKIESINTFIDDEEYSAARQSLGSLKKELGETDTDIFSLETRIQIMEYLKHDKD